MTHICFLTLSYMNLLWTFSLFIVIRCKSKLAKFCTTTSWISEVRSHISIPRRHAVNQIATMNKRYVAGKIALYDITHGTKLHGSFGGARSLKTCRWFMGSLWWAILVSVSVGLTSLAFNKAFPFDRLVNDTTKLLILTRIRII